MNMGLKKPRIDMYRVMPVVGFIGTVVFGVGFWVENDTTATVGLLAIAASLIWWGNLDQSPEEKRKNSRISRSL